MAYLAVVGSKAVNGVAYIHSEIIKETIFKVQAFASWDMISCALAAVLLFMTLLVDLCCAPCTTSSAALTAHSSTCLCCCLSAFLSPPS